MKPIPVISPMLASVLETSVAMLITILTTCSVPSSHQFENWQLNPLPMNLGLQLYEAYIRIYSADTNFWSLSVIMCKTNNLQ